MQIVPLYNPTAMPDASHEVTAPGGYECWSFAVYDATAQLRAVAMFFVGCPFDPAYLRAYDRYRRRPTRVAPPTPRDCSAIYFALYRNDQIIAQATSRHPSSQVTESSDPVKIAIGSSDLAIQEDGSLHLAIRGVPAPPARRRPGTIAARQLAASFVFRPRFKHKAMQQAFPSRELSGADHRWILANPVCDAEGTVTLYGSGAPVIFTINGSGFHDHNFGAGVAGANLNRWLRGHISTGDSVIAFSIAYARDRLKKDESKVIEIDATGIKEISSDISIAWNHRTKMFLRYPAQISLNAQTRLENPRVIDATAFHLRLVYDATISGAPAKALCEIVYPYRLHWPILGRMIGVV